MELRKDEFVDRDGNIRRQGNIVMITEKPIIEAVEEELNKIPEFNTYTNSSSGDTVTLSVTLKRIKYKKKQDQLFIDFRQYYYTGSAPHVTKRLWEYEKNIEVKGNLKEKIIYIINNN